MRQQLGWWATKRAMARVARAKKRAVVTNGDNMGNGYGKESGGHLTTAATGMA